MFNHFLRKHRKMLLTGIFFFYLGCGITLTFIRMDCAEAVASVLQSENPLEMVEYAVLILTSPGNVEKRDAVRATWGKLVSNIVVKNGEKLYRWNHAWVEEQSHPPDFVRFFFVVGIQDLEPTVVANIKNENSRNNDMLLLDSFRDSYKNLAVKLQHSVRWLQQNAKGLKYMIKCDDDSFVRIDLMIRDLEAYAPDMNAVEISEFVTFKTSQPSYKGLYWGYFDGKARVYLSGKWEEKDWFLCDNYLPYALGGGYVISRSIVEYIGRNYDFLSHYKAEDASMGLWTSALDGINRVHDTRFDTEWRSRGCLASMLVRHKQTPKDMFKMYRTLVHSKGEKLCKTETLERQSYSYKWDVLPSMCCR